MQPAAGAVATAYDAPIAATDPTVVPGAAPDRFPTFEGLRALCALAIVAFHAGTFTGLTGPGGSAAGAWVRHLNVGVSVFFVLSALLLYRPFVVAHLRDEAGPRLLPYLARRAVRIYPAYWAALFVTAVVLDQAVLGDWWGKLRFYSLTQIYWGDTALGGLPQAWSLCTEVSFYLVLPAWAALVARVGGSAERRRRAHLLGCLAWYVGGLGFRAALRAGDHALGYAWLPANTDLFALGMVLAVVSAGATTGTREPGGLWRTLGEWPAVAWLAALCTFWAVTEMGFPFEFLQTPTVGEELGRQVLFGVIAVLLVAPGVVGPQDQGVVRRLLTARPLWALGVVSYGIYLWHISVLVEVDDRLRPAPGVDGVAGVSSWWALVAVSTVIATVVAAASWFALERPTIRWVRRIGRR